MVPRVQVDHEKVCFQVPALFGSKDFMGKVASEKKMIMIEKKSMSARTKAKFLRFKGQLSRHGKPLINIYMYLP